MLGGLGRTEEALAAFDRALALDAELAQAHQGRGLALEILGRQAEAAEAYTEAERLAAPGADER